jgi:hypothetical protein
MLLSTSTWYSSGIRRYNWKLEVLSFLITVVCDQRAEPPTDLFIMQAARMLLPNETPSFHVCCLGMVSPIRCEQQLSWGYWRTILLATSVVSAWLSRSYVSNIYDEDNEEWSSSPRLLSRHAFPNQTWATRTNGQLFCFNEWTFTKSHYFLV